MLNQALLSADTVVESTPPSGQLGPSDPAAQASAAAAARKSQASAGAAPGGSGAATAGLDLSAVAGGVVLSQEEAEEIYEGFPTSVSGATTCVPAYSLLGDADAADHRGSTTTLAADGSGPIGATSATLGAPQPRHLQGVVRTAIAFTRSMIGSAALYMPRMFYTGGLAFSTVLLVSACAISTYNIILLSRAHDRLAANNCRSYGDIVFVAWGRPGKWVVDALQAINQIGWVPIYFIFVQQNLFEAIPALSKVFSPEGLMAFQLLIYVPLSWLRHIKYLSTANLVANVFVSIGLVACIVWSCVVLARDGPAPDVQAFNRHDCFLFLGAVAVSFEGMSLVLPIKRSMKRPDRFEPLVVCAMACLCVLVWSIGALGYLAFGNDVEPFVTNELPTKGLLGPAVRVLYSLAMLCTYPLQIFPGTLILEEYLIEPCRLPARKRKIAKNLLRMLVVVGTCAAAVYAGKALDHFVSLIGTIGSIPLGLLLPTLVHLWIFWKDTTVRRRCFHALLVALGFVSMLLSGSITISTW